MEMTISEYCLKYNGNRRYILRIITANKVALLHTSYGINSFKLMGKTYILNVNKDFTKKD